ncbi:MAG: SRPBCC domain-containing protein, partial [Panacagrimonas sp.]
PLPFGALSSLRVQRIEAIDDGHCQYHTHFELQGWLMPVVRRLLGPQLHVGFSGMTQGLKRRAEQMWANQNP